MQYYVLRQMDQLRLVSILHGLGSALVLLVSFCGLVTLSGATTNDPSSAAALPWIRLGVTLFCILVILLLFASCLFAANRSCRWVSFLASLLFLPFFPIGTIIGVFSLVTLTSPVTQSLYEA